MDQKTDVRDPDEKVVEIEMERLRAFPNHTAVDRLAHFKKAAVVLNTTPRAALMGMLSKHLISVSDMCMGEQQYSKEQWDEKITDSINYFLILCAIVEEELNEEN